MFALRKILTIAGSVITVCFGIWHFFVPEIWNWYSYITPGAPELITAVRAINVFFSLCLVLFGIINILFINQSRSNRYPIIVMLSATSLLWLTRICMQLVYPQGSQNPLIQYGMLTVFIVTSLCFLIPLCCILSQKTRVNNNISS
jgi:hypothetical protein